MNMKHKKNAFNHYYEMLMEYAQSKYVKEVLIALLAVGLLAGGYSAFQWYKKRQNVQAFAALVEISKAYENALTAAQNQQNLPEDQRTENPWEDVQLLLEALSSANKGSSLSPLFVFYQAELALKQEGDYDKACKLMEKGIDQLSKSSVYYDMFNLKRIKMLLDSPQENVAKAAVADLQLIAGNKNNYYYQDALHTLGMFQAAQGNMPAAIEAWTNLVKSQPEKSVIVSPFVTQAQDKLKSLNITLEKNN